MLLHHNALGRPRSALFSGKRFKRQNLGIKAEPSFSIRNNDRAFGIGSCFAREVGRMLHAENISSTFGGFSHRYNPLNIVQALKWALHGGYERKHLIELDDGRWFDAHHKADIEAYQGLEQAYIQTRTIYERVGHALRSASVFVVTFGLAEVWYDHQAEVWLNQMPPRRAISDFAQRFSVHALDHAMARSAMVEMFELVRGVCPDMKFICSISPIPMRATFCHNDVIVATANGKATLRSALFEAIREVRQDGMRHVDYFPSYEIVTYQRNDDVYMHERDGKSDHLHIHPEFIDTAIQPVFHEAYLAEKVAERKKPSPRAA